MRSTTQDPPLNLATKSSIMAILHDVEVTISAKGKRLKEYDDDAEEPSPSNTATKYIEALTGASFQVHYTIKPALQFKSSGIVIRIEIDGEHMDSDVLIRGQHLKETNRVCYSSTFNGARRFQNQGWTLQAFIFAEIKTSRLCRRQVTLFTLLTLSR